MNDAAKIFKFKIQYLFDEDENTFENWDSVEEHIECGFIIALSMKDAYEQIDSVYGLDLPYVCVESLKIDFIDSGTMVTFNLDNNNTIEDIVEIAEVYDGRHIKSNEYYAFMTKTKTEETEETEEKVEVEGEE